MDLLSGDGSDRNTQLVACLRRIIDGHDAWPELWQLLGKVILSELHRLGITCDFERDDILQEIALILLRDDCRFIREHLSTHLQAPFQAYIRVMARHTTINYLRKRKRAIHIEFVDGVPPQGLANPGDWNVDPVARLEQQQTVTALLEQSIGGRSNRIGYQIMYLRFVEHASVNQIAERMRMHPNTVSQRIRYYVQRLRKLYGVALPEHGHE